MAIVSSTSPFLPITPGWEWKMVGYLNMSDPNQLCPDSWKPLSQHKSSCGKKSNAPCDSLRIKTSGASYQTVCGWFRGYQVGSPDAFYKWTDIETNIDTYYVDGITVTYGSPGSRHHVYTYAAGVYEAHDVGKDTCPCAGGKEAPKFVGRDHACESGNSERTYDGTHLYSSDVLWDGQQCNGKEGTCCSPAGLPWFCKEFPTPVSEDLEVRICTDEDLSNENVAIESYELYILVQVTMPLTIVQAAIVFNPEKKLQYLEIYWIPVGSNVTLYIVRVVSSDTLVGQGCTVCTTSLCHYAHQVTAMANTYTIYVTSINTEGALGSKNSTVVQAPTNSVFNNASHLSNDIENSIGCSFLNNQSFYCMVCCSTNHSVPPDSSVHNISTTRGTEVTVSLQGLTSGQTYYCKAAATNTNSTQCASQVVGGVKVYFSFVALPKTPPTTLNIPSMNVQALYVFNPDKTIRYLEISWIPVGCNVTLYIVRVVGPNATASQDCTACTTSQCHYVHHATYKANSSYSIFVTSVNTDGTFGLQNSITINGLANSIFNNAQHISNDNSIGCSFLNNQSFYCVVYCSIDPSVPPDTSVYSISTIKATEVKVHLQGLMSGQTYYCKAAATNSNSNSTQCASQVIGGVKMYFSFVALPTTPPTTGGQGKKAPQVKKKSQNDIGYKYNRHKTHNEF